MGLLAEAAGAGCELLPTGARGISIDLGRYQARLAESVEERGNGMPAAVPDIPSGAGRRACIFLADRDG